ncbi:MAG: hypothetical protein L0211_06540 [Planctomycetaceae bacterium]|nr:hypothetical protein [Planctomycetaceae bacterium]
MDSDIARIIGNPYASPAPTPEPAPAEQPKPQPGSLAIIFPGFILLLVGYLTSNVFAVADLYHVGFGPQGEFIPSPFASAFTTPLAQWLFYAVAAGAAIAGCVVVGSQKFNPMAVVIFVMCPIVGLVFLAGAPLRMAGRFATPIAVVYLAVGTCLAGAGIMRLVSLYGQTINDAAPMLASILTEVGLALLVGGLVKLWRSGAFSAPAAASAQGDLAAAR